MAKNGQIAMAIDTRKQNTCQNVGALKRQKSGLFRQNYRKEQKGGPASE
jgi:hypothetical protein